MAVADCRNAFDYTGCTPGYGFNKPATYADFTLQSPAPNQDSYILHIADGITVPMAIMPDVTILPPPPPPVPALCATPSPSPALAPVSAPHVISVTSTSSYFQDPAMPNNPYRCGNPGDPRPMRYTASTASNPIQVGGCDWDYEKWLRNSYPSNMAEAQMEFRKVVQVKTFQGDGINCSSDLDCTSLCGTVCGTAFLDGQVAPNNLVRTCGLQDGWWTAKHLCELSLNLFVSNIINCRTAIVYRVPGLLHDRGGRIRH